MHLRKTLLACGAVFALLVSVRPAHARFMPRLGAITLGGGVANFVKGQTEAQTTPGGAADARLTIGTGTPLAFEVNYLVTLSDDAVPELIPLLHSGDTEVLNVLGPGLVCRAARLEKDYAQASWQSMQLSHQAAWEALRAEPGLSRWWVFKVYEPRYNGENFSDYILVNGERASCDSLLESFVLEPGLTSEYR